MLCLLHTTQRRSSFFCYYYSYVIASFWRILLNRVCPCRHLGVQPHTNFFLGAIFNYLYLIPCSKTEQGIIVFFSLSSLCPVPLVFLPSHRVIGTRWPLITFNEHKKRVSIADNILGKVFWVCHQKHRNNRLNVCPIITLMMLLFHSMHFIRSILQHFASVFNCNLQSLQCTNDIYTN